MRNDYLHFIFASVASLLVACGGGSSGQGSDFGAGLSLDVSTLSFSAMTSDVAFPQVVHATISAADAFSLKVGYTAGNEPVSWLDATTDPIQGNVVTVRFIVHPVSSPGTYVAHPSIAIFRVDETPIAARLLTINYQVIPRPPFVSPTSIPLRMQVNDSAPLHQQLFVDGSGLWTVTVDYASGAGWLKVGSSNVFPQSGPAPIFLDLSPISTMPVGSYAATLHVAVGGQTFDVAVTLDVLP
jgi:hypothetical protein